jgi:SAM-dependent methyltransferase
VPPPATRRLRTLRRSAHLFGLFRLEQTDPERFYTALARDTVDLIAAHADLTGSSVVDVGAGRGEFAAAFAARGARYVGVDVATHAVSDQRALGVVALGERLPFADGSVDVVLSSNVLEHVRDPVLVADEALRIVRPGGLLMVSYTNWLSPWGGHETSPWHYLGGGRASRLYERRHGHPPKNEFGIGLHPVSVSTGLAWARDAAERGATVLEIAPRYHPWWACRVVELRGLREVLTWNLMVVLRAAG